MRIFLLERWKYNNGSAIERIGESLHAVGSELDESSIGFLVFNDRLLESTDGGSLGSSCKAGERSQDEV